MTLSALTRGVGAVALTLTPRRPSRGLRRGVLLPRPGSRRGHPGGMADLHSFFKRKDPPGGAPGAALKAAKTSSASIAGGVRWSTLHGSLLARVDSASPPNARVAAFDLDDTLQKTRSGKPGYMVTDLADFVYWSDAVRPKIRELHAQGVKIVVFSNQGGVKGAFEGKRAAVVRARIDALAADLQVPLDAFCATQKGPEKDPKGFRKPLAGMWDHFSSACNGGVAPNLNECYYVGDAAGRPGDHSDSDKGFAAAVGMRFYTPEAFFEAPSDHPPNDVETNKNEAKKQNGGGGADAVIVLDDEDDADAFDRENIP